MSVHDLRKARIHSFESFGAVDGPGIRFIVFFQGCFMRCLYCHNRDSWDLKAGKEVTVPELMKEVLAYKHFITPSGGVTASGGEATLQPEFLIEWFTACHEEGIHTTLDTNGYVKNSKRLSDALLNVTDLVMLDIKQIDDGIHKKLTGVSNRRVLDFARYLAKINKTTWIRYVVLPGWTDDDASIYALANFLKEMKNVERVELLPYHELGKHKWLSMGEKYQLDNIKAPTKESLEHIKDILHEFGFKVSY